MKGQFWGNVEIVHEITDEHLLNFKEKIEIVRVQFMKIKRKN